MMRVVVVGQGYVGLPLSVRAAQVGHQVIAYDIDENPGETAPRRRILHRGHPLRGPQRAPRAPARFTRRPKPVRAQASTSRSSRCPHRCARALPDLSYIEQAARTLARYLRPGATVVVESTTYPGTTEELVAPILEDGSGLVAGTDFHLGYSPERIDPGNSTWTLVTTPKIVSGVDEASLAAVQAFYDTVVDKTIPVASPREAELAKLLENTFRHVNIALVNEVAMFAHELGIDVWEAIDAASTKPFGFMRFTPGPGVGGHCLPIDPSYLSWRVRAGARPQFPLRRAGQRHQQAHAGPRGRRITTALNARRRAVNGSRILLLGLAYKKNTGDARESPRCASPSCSPRWVRRYALPTHTSWRPRPVDGLVRRVDVTPEEMASADAVVLLTDHDGFDFDEIVQHARFTFDCRHRLRGPDVEYL